ncbi:MAG TPA: hypothetical protein VMF13_19410 [Luteitalea sp.]|nr:hypothetical protein [Luteitalea sp.]
MNDDYLWDGSGDSDADVARLEQLLAPLALRNPRALPSLPLEDVRPVRADWRGWVAAAAVVLVSTTVGWSMQRGTSVEGEGDPWRVARVEGTPTLSAAPLARHSRLTRGRWLETDEQSSAVVFVGKIGRLEVAPRSRLRLLQASPQEHRAELVRGTIEAQIWAPPGQFAVDTPSATAVDLGCAYTLTIDDRGVGLLTVQAGWVGFEHDGRESFIPAGATGHTYPGRGPGTPAFDEAPAALRDAVRQLDVADSVAAQAGPLDVVLQSARREDGLTLWHLVDRVDPTLAPRVVDRLSSLVPMPDGVTREGVLAGDHAMRDAWWEALGLGTADWWRTWRQRWPHERLR